MRSGQARSHYIDVLRGAAALAVVISHADHAQLVDLGLQTSPKVFLGHLGVYSFFVLSGLLIWTSAKATLPTPAGLAVYAAHRLTRLLPLYLACVAFAMWALPHIESAFAPNPSGYVLLRHLSFTQALTPSVSRDLNPVLWTLTHEAIFYAIVPVLITLSPRLLPVVGLAALVGAKNIPVLGTFADVFHLFTLGILIAEGMTLQAVLWAALFSIVRLHQFDALYSSLALCATSVVAGLLLLPGRWLWASAPLRWVGVISFSVYIWHYLIVMILGTQDGLRLFYSLVGEPYRNAAIRGVLTIGLILAVSALSYWSIERPGMTKLRKFFLRRIRKRSQSQERQQNQPVQPGLN